MPYAIFETINQIPVSRLVPGPSGAHETMNDARLWLLQNKGKLSKGSEGYVIEPIDSQGLRLERVDDLESEALGELASELVRTDELIRASVGAMITARQLHASASEDVFARLEELRKSRDIPELVGEVLYQTAATKSQGHFQNVELAAKLPELVGWLKRICDRDQLAQVEDDREYFELHESKRREVPIYLPFSPKSYDTSAGADPAWGRENTLCFMGESKAVEYVLNYLEREIGSVRCSLGDADKRIPRQQVLRLTTNPVENDLPTAQVPLSLWQDSASSRKVLSKLFEVAGKFMDTACDVIMVDDLMLARTDPVAGRSVYSAGKAHGLLKRKAAEVGACLIAGIVLDVDTQSKASKLLYTHTTLLQVSHKTENGQVRLYLDGRLVVGPLPASDLEKTKKPTIELP